MKPNTDTFLSKARQALDNPVLQKNLHLLGAVLPTVRDNAMAQLGQFEELRAHLKQVRDHTMSNLDHYLRQYEEQVLLNGGKVHWAHTAAELNDIVLRLCQARGAVRVGKGKSMVTEETGLREHLQAAGLRVTETDLGEYIIQLAGEQPSHIVGPAIHKNVEEIRDLFLQQHPLGERDLASPEAMVQEARQLLREQFLSADVGIVGANALVAEDGSNLLVTNEGNGDLLCCLPSLQIVCASIDKVLPRAEDATALLRLLARSATGAAASSYASFYSGPQRPGDSDGPEEFHVVLLDNRRSDMLGGKYQDMLACMRCGACLNHCPIYMAAGGHSYGSVYPGPMGSVLTPLLQGLESAPALPNACTSCGRCAEVCPAAIPLPDLLRELRRDQWRQRLTPRRWRWGLALQTRLGRWPRLYRLVTGVGVKYLRWLARERGAVKGTLHRLPVKNGWTDARNLPVPEGATFMRQWQRRKQSLPSQDLQQSQSQADKTVEAKTVQTDAAEKSP